MRAVTSYFPDKNYGEEMIIWIPRYTKILTIDMHNYNELRPLHKEIMMIVFLFQYSLTNFLAKLLFPKIYIYFLLIYHVCERFEHSSSSIREIENIFCTILYLN